MDIEEIRQSCESGRPIPRIDVKYLLSEVDRLKAALPQVQRREKAAEKELIDYHHTQKTVGGKMAENARLRKINEQLTARAEKAEAALTESQRREQAAVEDLKKHRKYKCDCCYYADKQGRYIPCRDCQSPISNYGDGWQWRGPQEARKGDQA